MYMYMYIFQGPSLQSQSLTHSIANGTILSTAISKTCIHVYMYGSHTYLLDGCALCTHTCSSEELWLHQPRMGDVVVIGWDQGFMAVNQLSPEGAARVQGWFTLP